MTDSDGNTYSTGLASTHFESGKKYEFIIALVEFGDITANPWTEVTADELPKLETE